MMFRSIKLTVVFVMLYVWVRFIFADIYNFPCHLDVQPWVRALDSFSENHYVDAAANDRLPLTLWLSLQWMRLGFEPIDALLLNAQLSWVVCMTALFAACQRFLDTRSAILGLCLLLFSHTYSGLILSVSGQMTFNALVAILLWLGYGWVRSKNPISWILLGSLSMLMTLCKEQGFVYPFCVLFFLLFARRTSWTGKLGRAVAFVVGAAPIAGILWWWMGYMIEHGNKYQELFADLSMLYGESDFLGRNRVMLNWGTIETTFQQPKNYIDLYLNAWLRLTNEIGAYLLVVLGLTGVSLFVYRAQGRKWAWLFWTLMLIFPAVPFFVMLLIEPYHLSFMAVPIAGLFAWAIHHILPRGALLSATTLMQPRLFFGGLAMLGSLVFIAVRGQVFLLAVPWEIGSCITERLIPVIRYLEQHPQYTQKPILVSDVSIKYAKQLPQQFEVMPVGDELLKLHCRRDVLLLVSKTSTLYTQVSAYLHPLQWRPIQMIPAMNNESWSFYKAICR